MIFRCSFFFSSFFHEEYQQILQNTLLGIYIPIKLVLNLGNTTNSVVQFLLAFILLIHFRVRGFKLKAEYIFLVYLNLSRALEVDEIPHLVLAYYPGV